MVGLGGHFLRQKLLPFPSQKPLEHGATPGEGRQALLEDEGGCVTVSEATRHPFVFISNEALR